MTLNQCEHRFQHSWPMMMVELLFDVILIVDLSIDAGDAADAADLISDFVMKMSWHCHLFVLFLLSHDLL